MKHALLNNLFQLHLPSTVVTGTLAVKRLFSGQSFSAEAGLHDAANYLS